LIQFDAIAITFTPAKFHRHPVTQLAGCRRYFNNWTTSENTRQHSSSPLQSFLDTDKHLMVSSNDKTHGQSHCGCAAYFILHSNSTIDRKSTAALLRHSRFDAHRLTGFDRLTWQPGSAINISP
jgi:hypothetical protein